LERGQPHPLPFRPRVQAAGPDPTGTA
jgi:hypothetical protein